MKDQTIDKLIPILKDIEELLDKKDPDFKQVMKKFREGAFIAETEAHQ